MYLQTWLSSFLFLIIYRYVPVHMYIYILWKNFSAQLISSRWLCTYIMKTQWSHHYDQTHRLFYRLRLVWCHPVYLVIYSNAWLWPKLISRSFVGLYYNMKFHYKTWRNPSYHLETIINVCIDLHGLLSFDLFGVIGVLRDWLLKDDLCTFVFDIDTYMYYEGFCRILLSSKSCQCICDWNWFFILAEGCFHHLD